ncbi:hypothetical protein E4H12_05280 [Candidatus Thorarchaeota archaeon]|nr:MAG: hypothetical protein E4H12_05280 [Candidatus Thorarchaeota archaeon]
MENNEQYWKFLQSYKDAAKDSEAFWVEVTLVSGVTIRSSSLPTTSEELLNDMIDAIFLIEERGGLTLWLATEKKLVFVPEKSIAYTGIEFNGRPFRRD